MHAISHLLRMLLVVSAGLFVSGQFGRLEFEFGALYLHDIVLTLFVVLTGLSFFSDFKRLLFHTTFGKVFLAFKLLILLNIGLHFSQQVSQALVPLLYLLRFDVIVLFGISLFILLKQKIFLKGELERGVMVVLLSHAVLGLVQYVLFPDTRGLLLLGWDDHYYRLIGTIFDPGFLGILLAIGGLLTVRALLGLGGDLFPRFKVKGQRSRVIQTLVLLLFSLSLLLTYSRASYLTFLVGLLYLFFFTRKTLLIALAGVFVLSIFLLPRPGGEGVKLERTASITARMESNQSALQLTPLQFLIGKGWYRQKVENPTNTVQGVEVANHASGAENSFVFVLSSLGVVGLGVFLALLLSLVSVARVQSEAALALVVISVHALFSNTLFHPFVLILLVVLMARSAHESLLRSRSELG